MSEVIEIKRKEFEVIKSLGEHSFLGTRKNKLFFIKDFGKNENSFYRYVETETKMNATGIAHPKIYVYDKNTHVVASEYIEGDTVLKILLEKDLPDEIIEEAFRANWFSKRNKIGLHYEPEKWIYRNGKLYYICVVDEPFDDKKTFEKRGIRLWFYTRDFILHLNSLGIRGDLSRIGDSEAGVNKRIALAVVQYYL